MATRRIGFVFIEGFADWEFGFLSGSAPEWFGARPVALTPGGAPVVSIGGFRLAGERGLTPEESRDLDAVAVIGSDGWAAESHPDLAPLLISVAERGGVVGGICAGTLALTRAGLFRDRRTPATAAAGSSSTCGTMPAGSATATSRTPSPTAGWSARPAPPPALSRSPSSRRSIRRGREQVAQMRAMFAGEYRAASARGAAGGDSASR